MDIFLVVGPIRCLLRMVVFFKRGPLLIHLSYFSKNTIKPRSYGGRPSIPYQPEVSLLQQYIGCEIVEYEISQLEEPSIHLQEYIFDKLL